MNWKFWIWPRQIRELKTVVEKHEELLFNASSQQCQPRTAPGTDLVGIKYEQQLAAFKSALGLTPPDNALMVGVLAVLDWHARDEISSGCQADVSTEEAHRFRGRLGITLELRQNLNEMWNGERSKPVETK